MGLAQHQLERASIEELRIMILRQQEIIEGQQRRLERLEQLVEGKHPHSAEPNRAVEKVENRASPIKPLTFYGFLRADLEGDTQRMGLDSQLPFYVLSPGDPSHAVGKSGDFTLHPRLSRFGLEVGERRIRGGWSVKGKLETDFFNAFIERAGPRRTDLQPGPDNPAPARDLVGNARAAVRVRHAYVRFEKADWHILMGQTWDVVSPLYPSVNADTVMWNAGNTADRRPQLRIGYETRTGGGRWSLVGMVGSSGAVDGQDLDGDGHRDGEASGSPTYQVRVGYHGGKRDLGDSWAIGLYAHRAWQRLNRFSFAGKNRFGSFLVGADLMVSLHDKVQVLGEAWTGENLADVRGGIGQGVDPESGREVRARGGWLELSFRAHPRYAFNLGAALDNPRQADLTSAAARTLNRTYYLTNRITLLPGLTIGFDYARWLTRFKGLPEGKNHRFTLFLQNDF
jgi:hypothetical protein